MGTMFDWSREVITCLPEYYHWNQWFFLQFYKRGLAYRQKGAVDWCPNCNTTLAREQVIGDDRHCERCGTPVDQARPGAVVLPHHRLRRGAAELRRPGVARARQDDADQLDRPQRRRKIVFSSPTGGRTETIETIEVFTTRPDTIYGVTFMVLAPEHPLVEKLTTPERRADVEAYVEQARRQTEIERTAPTRRRPASSSAPTAPTPTTASASRSTSATTSWRPTAPAPSWACRRTTSATSSSPQKYGLPIPVVIAPPDWDGAPLLPRRTRAGHDGELRPVRRHAERRGQARRRRLRRGARLREARPSPIACATG